MKEVKSSLIEAIGYDEEKTELRIKFKRGIPYSYANVPKEVWQELIDAKSIGSFFIKNIKGKYETLLHNSEL